MKVGRKPKIIKEKYIELYYKKRLSIQEVANYFNCSPVTVANFRCEHNLPKRGWANGHPFKGKHHSTKTKFQISNSRKGRASRENNGMWKGGKYLCHGYVMVLHNGKYMREQRLVMEQYLGRPLKQGEQIHHLNGNTLDNRIENLKLFSSNSNHIAFHHKISSFRTHLNKLHRLG